MRAELPWLAIMAGLVLALPVQAESGDAFGSKENTGAGLIGILYDFKQNQKRQATGVRPENFSPIVEEFLSKGWDESILNRYYRATSPLYTTQIFIPEMGAEHAPRAFGVEKLIRPSNWVIVYKGQVRAPSDGRYRFVAYADDVIAVAVDGRLVLLAGRPDCIGNGQLEIWPQPEQGQRVPASNGQLVYGNWLDLKKDQTIDLDVLIGERPGGKFSAFLLYEKEGQAPPKDAAGVPKFPVFQLAPAKVPEAPAKFSTTFTSSEPLWTGIQ